MKEKEKKRSARLDTARLQAFIVEAGSGDAREKFYIVGEEKGFRSSNKIGIFP